MPKVYFLCTGNACRSQMAEGFAKKLLGRQWQVKSAGIEAHGLSGEWFARSGVGGFSPSPRSN